MNRTAIAATVEELISCLVAAEPGLSCPLASSLMSGFGPAEHYISVLRSPTRDSQDPDPAVKGNMARFLWNYLASRTAEVRGTLRLCPCMGFGIPYTWLQLLQVSTCMELVIFPMGGIAPFSPQGVELSLSGGLLLLIRVLGRQADLLFQLL